MPGLLTNVFVADGDEVEALEVEGCRLVVACGDTTLVKDSTGWMGWGTGGSTLGADGSPAGRLRCFAQNTPATQRTMIATTVGTWCGEFWREWRRDDVTIWGMGGDSDAETIKPRNVHVRGFG